MPESSRGGGRGRRSETMKKVLVVDDEESIRELYRADLSDEGYEVELAVDGRQALVFLESFLPNLVTLDIKLPDIDGIEVLRRIREKNATIPVILLTAFGEFRQDFNTWASDAYIVKSHDTTELKDTVRRLLGEG
jgi:two-component system, response regulator, stage 0 sporulation protein F